MASFHKSLYLFVTFFFALLAFSKAYTFNVGGRYGWTLHPSESYNEFSGRSRFIVNDTLHFKYNAASDSVLEVSKSDYDNCNMNNPITTLTGGDSFFNLNRSGPFYFISGNKSHCDQGQKLEVVVISPKTRRSHSAAPPPGGSSPVPNASPVSSPPVSTSPMGSPVSSPPEPGTTPMGSPMSSPPEPGTTPMGSPFSSPPEPGTTPMGSPISSPPESGMSPADSPGGISASPTGNPSDVSAPAPMRSPSARVSVSETLNFSLVVMIFGLGFFY
ncbi:hypothetical protein L2E82_25806 [Cichorium intybus]|uniref:Uncharacterized protein n=1 Tax=Cichorium intybus TaxID=13427 RepID=A0ACB9E432_CICIN|nr:hypothetical protein L2E82_25806 [Cichorium intybus]